MKTCKKRFGRFTAIILVLVMGVSFTACTGGDKASSSTTSVSTASGSTSQVSEKKYDKRLKISIAQIENVKNNEWNNAYHKFFENKFNIEWDYNYVDWNSWTEKLRVWINSGDLPDVAVWNYANSDAMNDIKQGLFYRLPDDWKSKWPNVATAYAASPMGKILEEKTGGTYVLPRPIYVRNTPANPLVNQIGVIALRKDWAKAIGFKLKDAYTVDETLEYARLLKEKDPGKIGSGLIPLSYDPSNALTCLVTANSTHSRVETAFYKDENGTYKWGPADKETLDALKIYQKAYKDGLLGPEFYTMNDNDSKEKFYVNGTAGLYQMGGLASFRQDVDSQVKKNLKLNSNDIVQSAIILGNDGKHHNIIDGANFWSSLVFSPKISKENFERIMDMIDYTCTEEGQLLCNMGFEGTDWKKDSNGELISLLPEGTGVNDKYPARFESLYILGDDFSVINPSIKKEYRDRAVLHYQDKAKYGKGALAEYDWDYQLLDSKAKNQVQFDYAKEYANLILKSGDLETNWKAWVQSKMSLVQPFLDELNKK